LDLDFGFSDWDWDGTYDYVVFFSFLFSFPFFSLFGTLMIFFFWRDGSGTKSGSSEAFGLMLYPSPLAAKAKAQKARARGSPTCLIGLGGILWFYFVCDCNCYLLLGGGSVGCAVGEEVFRRLCLKWTGLDWTELERTGLQTPSWLPCYPSILGSDLDLVLDGDLDGCRT
jgi:hypothetical protein